MNCQTCFTGPDPCSKWVNLKTRTHGNHTRHTDQEQVARVRACNFVKFETMQSPVLKIVTCTDVWTSTAGGPGILFLVRFNNFAWTVGFYWS